MVEGGGAAWCSADGRSAERVQTRVAFARSDAIQQNRVSRCSFCLPSKAPSVPPPVPHPPKKIGGRHPSPYEPPRVCSGASCRGPQRKGRTRFAAATPTPVCVLLLPLGRDVVRPRVVLGTIHRFTNHPPNTRLARQLTHNSLLTVYSRRRPTAHRIQDRHLVRTQFPIEDVQVLLNVLRVVGRRRKDQTLLDNPA